MAKGDEVTLKVKARNMLARGLSGAKKALKGFAKTVGSVGGKLAKFGAVGGAVAVGGIAKAIHSTVQFTDNLRQLRQATGLSTQAVQEYNQVARHFNIRQGAMADAVKEAQNRLDEFAETGKGPAAEAMQRLGLDAEETAKLLEGPNELLPRLADRIRLVGSEAGKVRIADEIFGGQGAEQLMTMLEAGGKRINEVRKEVRELGMVTGEEADRAREFSRAWQNFTRAMAGVRNKVVLSFLGPLADLTSKITDDISNWLNSQKWQQVASTVQGIYDAIEGGGKQRKEMLTTLKDIVGVSFKLAAQGAANVLMKASQKIGTLIGAGAKAVISDVWQKSPRALAKQRLREGWEGPQFKGMSDKELEKQAKEDIEKYAKAIRKERAKEQREKFGIEAGEAVPMGLKNRLSALIDKAQELGQESKTAQTTYDIQGKRLNANTQQMQKQIAAVEERANESNRDLGYQRDINKELGTAQSRLNTISEAMQAHREFRGKLSKAQQEGNGYLEDARSLIGEETEGQEELNTAIDKAKEKIDQFRKARLSGDVDQETVNKLYKQGNSQLNKALFLADNLKSGQDEYRNAVISAIGSLTKLNKIQGKTNVTQEDINKAQQEYNQAVAEARELQDEREKKEQKINKLIEKRERLEKRAAKAKRKARKEELQNEIRDLMAREMPPDIQKMVQKRRENVQKRRNIRQRNTDIRERARELQAKREQAELARARARNRGVQGRLPPNWEQQGLNDEERKELRNLKNVWKAIQKQQKLKKLEQDAQKAAVKQLPKIKDELKITNQKLRDALGAAAR